jgi:hypothetical protein
MTRGWTNTHRHYAYAPCTEAEYAQVKARATAAGLSVANYVRRAINSLWLEEGDDVPLLAELSVGRRRPTK